MTTASYQFSKSRLLKLLTFSAMLLLLLGCRGDDSDQPADAEFPKTADPDGFALFLNPAPGVAKNAAQNETLDNFEDFPEAYYNTIDPQATRQTFENWKIQNGFLNADGSEAICEAPSCASTHVKFRDTKDLGYGRNMFLRWNKITGDVAVFVENFQVAGIPGVPYGPLNLQALVDNDRSWNFGVNAIEFSSFPYTPGSAAKFAKFYNFSGDGKLALLSSGSQQHYVDLDDRGLKPMPTPCIVCHGGHGRTLVIEQQDGKKVLAPTITGGTPGDLQAHLQMIEFNTLQFSNAAGFSAAENEAGIRLINEAVLSTYKRRTQDGFQRSGDWDPAFAIEVLEGRYGGDLTAGDYRSEFAPAQWSNNADEQSLFTSVVAPNCTVCHALRGSQLNQSASFGTFNGFLSYAERIDHLVFERGLMPAGLLNYADLWESGRKNPAELARRIGKGNRLDETGSAIPPGKPSLKISAPLIATGFNSANDSVFDIPLSTAGSAFVSTATQQWSVEPANTASITPVANEPNAAFLRAQSAGDYTVTVNATGTENNERVSASWTIRVDDQLSPGALPPAAELRFFADGDTAIRPLVSCIGCHSAVASAGDGMPVFFEACQSTVINGFDFFYRSVLARTNFSDPLSSLILTKPLNGASDIRQRDETIPDYHGGGVQIVSDENVSRMISWILNGAPRGDVPTEAPAAGAPQCL